MNNKENNINIELDIETDSISVMVCKGSTGQIIKAYINLSDYVQHGIYTIADQIGYDTDDAEKIGLFNMTKDFEYNMEEKFSDRNTSDSDLLFMINGGACHK
ncbi:MAG: hypothetical protein IPP08_09625 [Chlorobiota bacterium]|jgi:hypothetical protein|nr:hypothetical protein [Chlorobiota bacterium]QQS66021.1 MAG: hypothetical protein IPP08_09625 [Chlorobiota bacterium]